MGESSPIASICCHPAISGSVLVAFQNGRIMSFSPLQSLEPRSEVTLPSKYGYPINMCFGSTMGSDCFSLYLLLSSNQLISISPFPLEGYRLHYKDYCDIIKEDIPEVSNWLYQWVREEKEDVSELPFSESHFVSVVKRGTTPNIVTLVEHMTEEPCQTGELVMYVVI